MINVVNQIDRLSKHNYGQLGSTTKYNISFFSFKDVLCLPIFTVQLLNYCNCQGKKDGFS